MRATIKSIGYNGQEGESQCTCSIARTYPRATHSINAAAALVAVLNAKVTLGDFYTKGTQFIDNVLSELLQK